MKKYLLTLAVLSILASCGTQAQKQPLPLLDKAAYDTIRGDKPVSLYTLVNKSGATLQMTNYGARLVALWVPDRQGVMRDVMWGYESAAAILRDGSSSGAVVGRYGNRIAAGRFTLDGVEYQLGLNNGPNHLHGGRRGWGLKVWDAEETTDTAGNPAVKMTLVSPDGDESYPGELTISVTYSLTPDNEVVLDYRATTTAPTVLNPTNHAYFNLHGTSEELILSHVMTINADNYTPFDGGNIPTGEIRSVEGTALDFRTPMTVGDGLNSEYKDPDVSGGYDHNWVLNKTAPNEVSLAAEVYEPSTGIVMKVLTSEPGIQIYTCNSSNPYDKGKYGGVRVRHNGIALETQHYPDSPNHPNFPTTVLRPGETFTSKTVYAFSTK